VGLPENWITVNPQFLAGNLTSNFGSSIYHSLQMEYNKRFADGLNLNANYTLAKAFGDEEGDQTSEQVANFRTLRNRSLNRRLLSFSIKHAMNVSGFYELPFGQNHALLGNPSFRWLSPLVSGWQLGWVFTAQAGHPLGLTVAANTFNDAGGATGVASRTYPFLSVRLRESTTE
jgi:hypothetical protein